MKKIIFLLLVISATVLTAQNYQYFTAKQGIPKALEIAKAYFQSNSVELYEIKCSRWVHYYFQKIIVYDSIYSLDDSTGKSLYWYYDICDSKDSCRYFRIWNKAGNYEYDSVFFGYIKPEGPLFEYEILIDTDSLIKCIDSLRNYGLLKFQLYYARLFNTSAHGYINEHPMWYYEEHDNDDIARMHEWVNTYTCEFRWGVDDVPEKNNNNNSSFTIKSDPNIDNITIELNSDLFQEVELRLYDQVGILLFADKLNNKRYELSTYNYPSGLYILQIKHGGDVITKTVMIVH